MRVVAVATVGLLVAMTVAYQVLVAPELTAREFQLWRVGGERVTVLVDEAADVVHVVNGRGELSEFFVVDGSLVVRADEVGSSLGLWVRVPVDRLGAKFQALTAARIGAGVSVGVKESLAMTEDVEMLVAVVLGDSPGTGAVDGQAFLCVGGLWRSCRAGPATMY
ncbi:MAG: hypothetical protein R2705_01330 [Ilumatobacteraceae bacterium]